MNTNKKALLAVAMVALMLAVPFTIIGDSEQADATSYWPTKPSYTYTVDFTNESNIIVKSGSNVMISPLDTGTEADVATLNNLDSHDDTVYKLTEAGTLTPGNLSVAVNNLVKFSIKDNAWVKCTAWTWNSSGVGPFGAFYAAISLGIEDEQALSTTPGHIAYILSPNNLTHAIKYMNGSTITAGDIDISSKLTNYNVMLVIPTVYWSVQDKVVTLSNAASTGAMAYAHQADGYIYPYLAIGVYEATADDTYGLLSKTGVAPTGSKDLPTFRTYVNTANQLLTDSVGTYQMWNLYEWTLYKLMAEAYISSVDSTAKAGGLVDQDTHATAGATAGAGNSAGPQSASGTESYGKILIENAWGSLWDLIDNTFVKNGVLKAGSGLTNELSATNAEVTGQDYTGGQIAISGGTSGQNIAEYSQSAASFGVPLSANNSTAVIPDAFWFNSSGNREILVGVDWNHAAEAGLSAWYSGSDLTYTYNTVGARLAYLMSSDAADTTIASRVVKFVETDYTTSVKISPGSSVTLYDAPDTAEGTFAGWYFDRAYTQPAGPTNGYYAPPESVTLYAKYDPVYNASVSFYEWNGNAYSDTAGQSYSGLVSGDSVMIPGANSPTVTANNITYEFVGWYKAGTVPTTEILTTGQTNYANTLYDVSDLTAATAVNMYAVYAASGDYWTVTVHENEHTAFASNTVVINVPKGDSFVLPEPAPSTDANYTFGHWSSDATQQEDVVLGYPGMIITPTANMDIYSWFSAIAQPNATITFQNDVGTTLAGETINAFQGQYITLPNCAVSQDGWVLKGWKLSGDTSETPTIVGTYGSKYRVPNEATTTLVAVPMQLSSGGGSVDVNNVVLGDYYEPSEGSWVISSKTPEELAALFDIVIPAEILPGTHGMIMITPNSNYVIDHLVVADNTGDDDDDFEATGVVVPLDKYRWMIQSVTGDVKINIYMKEDDGTSYGVKDFYISGLTGTPSNDGMTLNTGAVVKLIGDYSGLKAGSVSIKGTSYTVDEDGMRTYSAFTSTVQDAVANGDAEYVGSIKLGESGLEAGQIYCVYAEYTDNANGVDPTFKIVTPQLLAPRAA